MAQGGLRSRFVLPLSAENLKKKKFEFKEKKGRPRPKEAKARSEGGRRKRKARPVWRYHFVIRPYPRHTFPAQDTPAKSPESDTPAFPNAPPNLPPATPASAARLRRRRPASLLTPLTTNQTHSTTKHFPGGLLAAKQPYPIEQYPYPSFFALRELLCSGRKSSLPYSHGRRCVAAILAAPPNVSRVERSLHIVTVFETSRDLERIFHRRAIFCLPQRRKLFTFCLGRQPVKSEFSGP